jgi:hypothetical protein
LSVFIEVDASFLKSHSYEFILDADSSLKKDVTLIAFQFMSLIFIDTDCKLIIDKN